MLLIREKQRQSEKGTEQRTLGFGLQRLLCTVRAAFAMEESNSLIEQRKAKLAALRARGVDPFRNKFSPTEKSAEARANYAEGREVAVAGRVTAHRDMGKSLFIDVRDESGRIQVYAQKNVL